jgi:hypothetical protein
MADVNAALTDLFRCFFVWLTDDGTEVRIEPELHRDVLCTLWESAEGDEEWQGFGALPVDEAPPPMRCQRVRWKRDQLPGVVALQVASVSAVRSCTGAQAPLAHTLAVDETRSRAAGPDHHSDCEPGR